VLQQRAPMAIVSPKHPPTGRVTPSRIGPRTDAATASRPRGRRSAPARRPPLARWVRRPAPRCKQGQFRSVHDRPNRRPLPAHLELEARLRVVRQQRHGGRGAGGNPAKGPNACQATGAGLAFDRLSAKLGAEPSATCRRSPRPRIRRPEGKRRTPGAEASQPSAMIRNLRPVPRRRHTPSSRSVTGTGSLAGHQCALLRLGEDASRAR
jgi:hypothetical protein